MKELNFVKLEVVNFVHRCIVVVVVVVVAVAVAVAAAVAANLLHVVSFVHFVLTSFSSLIVQSIIYYHSCLWLNKSHKHELFVYVDVGYPIY